MTVARSVSVAIKTACNKNSKQVFKLHHCECGGEVKILSTVTGLCLACGLIWTSASVYQHLYRCDFDDNEDDIPY